MSTLDHVNEFLNATENVREFKRAMAIKLLLLDFEPCTIAELLNVTESFVSKWKRNHLEHGVDALTIQYHGYQGYLTPAQRQAILEKITTEKLWTIDDLVAFVRSTYGVEFKSRQSYYAMLAAARITWKRAQSQHPKKILIALKPKKRH